MGTKKILIIERDKEYQALMNESLSQGYEINTVSNSTSGLFLLTYYVPDLILLDISYSSRSNRYSTLIKLKKEIKLSSIPVIILSDIDDKEVIAQGLALGATDYFLKNLQLFHLDIKIKLFFSSHFNRMSVFSEPLIKHHPKNDFISIDQDFKNKFEVVADELIGEAAVSTNLIASKMAISVSTLERWTKKLYGISPMKYIVDYKLDRAKHLLKQNAGNVNDISHLLGFGSISYFSTCFKKKYGESPRNYIETRQMQSD